MYSDLATIAACLFVICYAGPLLLRYFLSR